MNGIVAKDTSVILNNAYSIDLLHGSKYTIVNYSNQKKGNYRIKYIIICKVNAVLKN